MVCGQLVGNYEGGFVSDFSGALTVCFVGRLEDGFVSSFPGSLMGSFAETFRVVSQVLNRQF